MDERSLWGVQILGAIYTAHYFPTVICLHCRCSLLFLGPLMGFIGQKIACMGEVPVVVADPELVGVMLYSSTINQVGWIHWALGLAGGDTESSS